ncbi:MAG: TetR/AcrR family transcriptional regulator [Tenuifilaceae bacterium]
MKELQKETEIQILDAARKVFIRKGLDGARMQEIADEAKINKALLHYYFRSKDKLFEMIFQEEIGKFFPKMVEMMSSQDISFEDKIRTFVNNYISIFINNPFLPSFILRELHRDPENLKQYFIKSGFDVNIVNFAIIGLSKQLNMTPEEARNFMINMISLCIFPFAGRPLIEKILFSDDKEEYNKFLENRKINVAEFLISSLNNR